jgi:hypothetical protein
MFILLKARIRHSLRFPYELHVFGPEYSQRALILLLQLLFYLRIGLDGIQDQTLQRLNQDQD